MSAAEPPAAPPLRQSLRLKRVRPTPEAHLASLIREAQHCVFITGAGLSTNTGIRDYRGENGVWTEAKKAGAKEGTPGIWSDEFYRTIPGATPTLAHTGVAALVAAGHAKYVISQNEDGLHLRAGLDRAALSELHGNDFIEVCDWCCAEVRRTFVTYFHDTYKKENPLGRHVTGRSCPRCVLRAAAAGGAAAGTASDDGSGGSADPPKQPPPLPPQQPPQGRMLDMCVDFGECPEGKPWGKNDVHRMRDARDAMARADLVVAWGTSLSVVANYFDPWDRASKWAKERPRGLRQKGAAGGRPCQLAIVNVGKVLDEELAVLKAAVDVDVMMGALLRELGMAEPPPYELATDPFVATAVAPREGEPAAEWRIGGLDGRPWTAYEAPAGCRDTAEGGAKAARQKERVDRRAAAVVAAAAAAAGGGTAAAAAAAARAGVSSSSESESDSDSDGGASSSGGGSSSSGGGGGGGGASDSSDDVDIIEPCDLPDGSAGYRFCLSERHDKWAFFAADEDQSSDLAAWKLHPCSGADEALVWEWSRGRGDEGAAEAVCTRWDEALEAAEEEAAPETTGGAAGAEAGAPSDGPSRSPGSASTE